MIKPKKPRLMERMLFRMLDRRFRKQMGVIERVPLGSLLSYPLLFYWERKVKPAFEEGGLLAASKAIDSVGINLRAHMLIQAYHSLVPPAPVPEPNKPVEPVIDMTQTPKSSLDLVVDKANEILARKKENPNGDESKTVEDKE